jgi:hypothetical protein
MCHRLTEQIVVYSPMLFLLCHTHLLISENNIDLRIKPISIAVDENFG